jgi:hypothetical protein
VRDKVLPLMLFSRQQAIDMFVTNMDRIPVSEPRANSPLLCSGSCARRILMAASLLAPMLTASCGLSLQVQSVFNQLSQHQRLQVTPSSS